MGTKFRFQNLEGLHKRIGVIISLCSLSIYEPVRFSKHILDTLRASAQDPFNVNRAHSRIGKASLHILDIASIIWHS